MRLRALFGLTLGVLAYAGTAAAAPDNPAAIARAQAHVRQNAAALSWSLSDDEIAALDHATR